MKWINIIYLITSIVIALFIYYAMWNCKVSYQYEILEPPNVDKIDVQFASNYLIIAIETLRYFLCYLAINIIYLLILILKKYK
jgi:hypothetical protein